MDRTESRDVASPPPDLVRAGLDTLDFGFVACTQDLTPMDTLATIEVIDDFFGKSRFQQPQKIERFELTGSTGNDSLYGGALQDILLGAVLQRFPGVRCIAEESTPLRRRFAVLATGSGRWEDPGESWRLAHVLGSRGIPNRVDDWGPGVDHDWPTWLRMLPQYLNDVS